MLANYFAIAVVPLLWGESIFIALCLTLLRIAMLYHVTWLVNSAAHLFGDKPYDKTINPSENWFVAFLAMGKSLSIVTRNISFT